MQKQPIPKDFFDALDEFAKNYAKSESTTEPGRWARFLCKIIKPTLIIKLVAHAFGKDIPVALKEQGYPQIR